MLRDAVVPPLELGDGQEKVVIAPGKIKRLLPCSHLFISLLKAYCLCGLYTMLYQVNDQNNILLTHTAGK